MKGGLVTAREKTMEERVRDLELKLNSHIGWITDAKFGSENQVHCKHAEAIDEHYVCLDNFPPKDKPCIVYDMGIREQPQFGEIMATKYGCEVHAFDPSPVSVEWAEKELPESLKNNPKYTFHPYGVGGVDGNIRLYNYTWQQVSILRIPVTVSSECDKHGCELIDPKQDSFMLPVKTLGTIMRELGHSYISMLKLDVEGSEWAFLEQALDSMGCPPVDQMSIEYHHYTFDNRYGGVSTPEVNTLTTMLYSCGIKGYQIDYHDGGFPDGSPLWEKYGLKLYFNTASYARGLKPMEPGAEEE